MTAEIVSLTVRYSFGNSNRSLSLHIDNSTDHFTLTLYYQMEIFKTDEIESVMSGIELFVVGKMRM